MLQPDTLEFQWIGRFVDKQIIKFSPLGSFIQVDGRNVNTGGSSGAAKSTIFHAFDYLFGFNERPATVLQSRKLINPEENALWVKGTFTYSDSDDIVTIIRSKSMVEITIGGETFKKAKAEEKIEALMGMPADLFRKIIHKRQDEGGFFLNLGPTDMHNFLMDCIGLYPFKKKYEIIEKRLSELEKSIEKENQQLTSLKASLSATQDAVLALGLAPVQDMHREVILELKERADKSVARFLAEKSRCEALVEEYVRNRPDTTNPQYDATLRENLEGRRKEVEAKISACLQKERDRQEAVRNQISEYNVKRLQTVARIDKGARTEEDAAKIVTEIKSIREATCPTCTQEWKTDRAVVAEKSRADQLIALRPAMADAIRAKHELFDLDQNIADLKMALSPYTDPSLPDLNEELADIVEQILQEKTRAGELYAQQAVENKKKMDIFVAGEAELRKKSDTELEQSRGQMDVDRRVLDVAAGKLKGYEAAKITYDQTYNRLKKTEETYAKSVEECNSSLKIQYNEQILALETKKCIKMYISFSFDEALDAISEKATKIIRCIPNTKNATIQLEGTKETQKGAIKEEVNAVMSMDGEEGVPLKSFSGGERSSTDLAVDLAVIDYIEKKTGKGLNIFILDEPFKGLGTVEIEMALEVLKNSNTNKKLIIVDHNPEVKQMVQNRLVVVRDGLTSKVA